ncbi:hypothetical protein BHE90_008375 [Fusarium euwallaceae]|uniref:Uncharacterized protein n=1 Tax=Fusarium euwallaceae TaxID=1147111 RepID=A0A430LN45_9HYPO|nr:hypothetical protein BHE90_008375 [Fusarium euwallaceae]
MPIIALDSENEHLDEMLDELEKIFKPKKILYVEKRGQHVVTIPRKLTKGEQKELDEIGAGKVHEKSKPEEEGESSTPNAGGNPKPAPSPAPPKAPPGGKK